MIIERLVAEDVAGKAVILRANLYAVYLGIVIFQCVHTSADNRGILSHGGAGVFRHSVAFQQTVEQAVSNQNLNILAGQTVVDAVFCSQIQCAEGIVITKAACAVDPLFCHPDVETGGKEVFQIGIDFIVSTGNRIVGDNAIAVGVGMQTDGRASVCTNLQLVVCSCQFFLKHSIGKQGYWNGNHAVSKCDAVSGSKSLVDNCQCLYLLRAGVSDHIVAICIVGNLSSIAVRANQVCLCIQMEHAVNIRCLAVGSNRRILSSLIDCRCNCIGVNIALRTVCIGNQNCACSVVGLIIVSSRNVCQSKAVNNSSVHCGDLLEIGSDAIAHLVIRIFCIQLILAVGNQQHLGIAGITQGCYKTQT